MHVSVVNSYAATSLNVPVSLFRSVDFPTDGNPTKPTRQSPVFVTSKPSPFGPPLLEGSMRSRRSFASFAFSDPKCAAVALFFCVRLISSSMDAIFSMMSDMASEVGGGARRGAARLSLRRETGRDIASHPSRRRARTLDIRISPLKSSASVFPSSARSLRAVVAVARPAAFASRRVDRSAAGRVRGDC
eukprot:31269-Pelagococcus_subviridis.AAC.13